MKTVRFIVILMGLFAFLLIGCAHNITPRLHSVFETEYLNSQTSVKPIDLQTTGRCPGVRTLRVVNKESRTDIYTVYSVAGTSYTIVPTEYVNLVARYIEDKLHESNVPVDKKNGKEIYVWMEEVHADGTWSFGCNVKLKIAIPEIDYTHVYSGYEGSGIIMNAIGYATNLAIVEFIKDPVVEKYIQCSD
ncbi:hypothetical protein [Desulfosarcina ovata]|uniref:Lipoprotein n=1 Tax=Desulfosarcina ovata subsp. ovata TaxID=2752305 RepID=A0A5K8ADK0_9BACT|nr:hypothetical protein [Desulfosarcina ovata]BBO90020.1 hypothetical protein DSCOOX_32000 [Desulfosarcina ovata subsp. ovata]